MILLLAGTAEARLLAEHLADAGLDVEASLAGATRVPRDLPVKTRIGGFGGEAGFRAYLAERGITRVIDATHPYAHAITERTSRVCADIGLPYMRFERPGWRSRVGDNWVEAPDYDALTAIIPEGARVLSATGRGSLDALSVLAGRTLFLRVIDPPDRPFPLEGDYVVARPPFTQASEEALLRNLRIDWLLVKNSGGVGGRAKLDAARTLGIPVAMIARPPLPEGMARREQVLDVLEWAEGAWT